MVTMENEPQASAATDAGPSPLFDAWMQARTDCLKHGKEMSAAMQRRPAYSHPDRQAYQDTIMAPLIAERDRLRAAEQEAKTAMNAKKA